MLDEEGHPQDDGNPQEGPASGFNELCYSIGEAVRHGKTIEAIAELIKKYGEEIPKQRRAMRTAFFLGHGVTFFVVIAVGVLGYLKVISGETTGVILAAIVGHLYRDRRN